MDPAGPPRFAHFALLCLVSVAIGTGLTRPAARRSLALTRPPGAAILLSMQPSARRSIPLWAGLFLLLSLPAELAAQPLKSVVVLPFKGPGAAKARQGVVTALMSATQLTPAKALIRTGHDLTSPDGLTRACTELKVDAVVRGRVKRRRRRRFQVIVTVFDGGTGVAAAKNAATVRGARRLHRAGLVIGRKLLGAVQQCAHRPAAVVQPTPASPAEPAPEVQALPVYTGQKKPPAEAPPKKRSRLDGLLDASLAFGIAHRSYTLEGGDPSKDRRYEGGVFPEVRLALDVYPTAPFLSLPVDIGLGLSFSHHLSVSTKLVDASGQEVEYDTGSLEFTIGLAVRWRIFGAKPTSPAIKLRFGWGMRNFTLGQNDVLTSVKYRFLRVGLEGLVPFGTPYVGLVAGFDVRPVLKVGDEAVNAFGASSGGLGWSLRGGLGGAVAFGLFYRLVFEYLTLKNDFDGRFDIPNNVTVDPIYRRDPSTGKDAFIRGWLQIGYAL